jgi:hypothetical protein
MQNLISWGQRRKGGGVTRGWKGEEGQRKEDAD